MHILIYLISIAFALVAFFTASLWAASHGAQRFAVVVPLSSSVTAPPDVEVTQEVADEDQEFPPQRWAIVGNSPAGIVVSFSVSNAFTHSTLPDYKSDAELSLALFDTRGPASWSIVQDSDSTRLAEEDETATVQAASDGVGRAEVELTTRFLVDPMASLAPGTYELMVTSTVTMP